MTLDLNIKAADVIFKLHLNKVGWNGITISCLKIKIGKASSSLSLVSLQSLHY